MRCPTCQSETSVFDENCSRCDIPNGPLRRALAWKAVAGVVLVAGVGWYLLSASGLSPRRVTMDDIYSKVAADAEAQYNIARRQGDPIATCVHAGLVAAAHIQAQDEVRYRRWKDHEADDCQKAGVPR